MTKITLASILFSCLFSMSSFAQQQTANDGIIPFKLDGHIYLPSDIDGGHTANLLFDTGASGQLLVDTLYMQEQKWQLKDLKQAKMRGANGITMVDVSWKDHTVKNGRVTTTFPYLVLLGVRDILGKHADGIVGSKDFDSTPYEINYQYHFMRKLTAIPDSVKQLYKCIPLVVEAGKYMFKAKVWFDGKCIEGLYNIDTGSGNAIDFTAETTQKYALQEYKGITHTGHGLQMGVGDEKIANWIDAQADSMQLGSFTISNPEITLNPAGKGAFEKNVFVGNIGADILSNFNFVFDLANEKLYCRNFKEYEPSEKSYGIGWLNRTDICKGWIVRTLYDDSPADKAGIKLGETIIEVGGKKVDDYSWDEEMKLSNDSITIVLNTKNGKRTVTLAKKKLY
ncbi:MAG TPA: peptide-binding protein [Xylanibacter oryzae]|nr:peptide-binding protein [Xylanibacter oryzae]